MKDIPAFPELHYPNLEEISNRGMTLRDYFAIHAPTEEIALMGFGYASGEYLTRLSEARYKYADQMLKERLKEVSNE